MLSRKLGVVLSLLLVVGCSGDSDPGGADAATGADAAGDDFVELVTGAWTRASGTEGYTCVYKTIEETIWLTAFEPISPVGTHHTFVSYGSVVGPDGVFPCTANTNQAIFLAGSGVGTGAYQFPEGVALKIEAGQQMLLNLHLFNTSDSELTGVSGMRVKTIPQAEVVNEADAVVMGTTQFSIPPNSTQTASGSCTMPGDTTIVSIFPHMHQAGTHMKVTASSSVAGSVVLHDGAFDFDNQIVYPVDSVAMNQGDTVTIDCTWNNTTNQTLTFGDSSLQEMCFAVSYRYPPVGNTFCFF